MRTSTTKIDERALGEGLARAGTPLPEDRLARLWRFHLYLRKQNPRLNLTRIYNFEAMVRKHYVDSLLVIELMRRRGIDWPELTMDLGTGPGFPGIPLAIALPDKNFILAEGRGQRVEFLEEAVGVAGLNNAEVFGGRIHAGRGREVDAVITRAVELMGATMERMLPYVRPGGLFLFMKGPNCDAEIETAREDYAEWLELILDEAYTLPESRDHRRLVAWRRNGNPGPKATSGWRPPAEWNANTELISSRDNDRFKKAKALHTSRGIKKQGRALVSGLRLVNEYMAAHPDLCRAVLIGDGLPDSPETQEFAERWQALRPPIQRFQPELLRELDLIGTGAPLLLIDAPTLPDFDPREDTSGGTLFLPIGDPENLGAALRSAAAFDVARCVLLHEAAHPYHPRALRAAAGATPRLTLSKGPALADLSDAVAPIFVLDADGEDIREVDFPERFGLLTGPEGGFGPGGEPPAGMRPVRIPVSDRVESLNTTVALSLALYILKERQVL